MFLPRLRTSVADAGLLRRRAVLRNAGAGVGLEVPDQLEDVRAVLVPRPVDLGDLVAISGSSSSVMSSETKFETSGRPAASVSRCTGWFMYAL
jgi:hypothetical protein